MNLPTIRLSLLSFFIISFCSASHISSPLEFKQAVTRYIRQTDSHWLQHPQRHTDETVPYKKELRYLFKNYATISTSALLLRLRSAHQEMVKYESDPSSDVYKRYEQISSALLLTCAQSFFYDARNQILNALDEIDQLIMYWRYQQQHQISYFFGKSPRKWIMGKSQSKEIIHSLIGLERKQRELYTLLGALAEHAHTLTTCDVDYDVCYRWLDELLIIFNTDSSYDDLDGTAFDTIAAQLSLKLKRVDSLTDDLLRPISFARKSTHFVRHWIAYTTMLAAAGYVVHYHINNPHMIPNVLGAAQGEAKRLFSLLINPFDKIYKRLKIAFSSNDGSFQTESQVDEFGQLSLDELCDQIQMVGKEIKSDINKELEKSNTTLREDAVNILQDGLATAEGQWIGTYDFDIERFKADLQILQERNDSEAVERVRATVAELNKQTWNIALWIKLNKGDSLLRIVDGYLEPLRVYTDIVDEKVIKLIQLISVVAEKLGRQGAGIAQQAEDQLHDQELTLMFAALIPLISTVGSAAYIYKWLTTKNYSPIRIALADVNALLIESASQLDDYAYGKLLYLVFKLRHRAISLKDPLAHEFLVDVTKLESKQYDSDTKHSIIENMFNKYAFLGRIAA